VAKHSGPEYDWKALLQFDQERIIEGLRHDAGAARRRGNEAEREKYLRQADQLDALPRLWEHGVQLTLDEYVDAQQVRLWIQYKQETADYEARIAAGWSPSQWSKDRFTELRDFRRYYWSPDGHMLCAIRTGDGTFTINREPLTPEAAAALRREVPYFSTILSLYEAHQAAGRSHDDLPLDTTPLPGPGPTLPEPFRLWRDRFESTLRARAAEAGAGGAT
jgi:hypothetical protein